MDCNPLIGAVEIYELLLAAEGHVMHHIGGDECLDNFDEELCGEVQDLISSASDAVTKLSPRTKRARLNLIWKDFVVSHKAAVCSLELAEEVDGDGNRTR